MKESAGFDHIDGVIDSTKVDISWTSFLRWCLTRATLRIRDEAFSQYEALIHTREEEEEEHMHVHTGDVEGCDRADIGPACPDTTPANTEW